MKIGNKGPSLWQFYGIVAIMVITGMARILAEGAQFTQFFWVRQSGAVFFVQNIVFGFAIDNISKLLYNVYRNHWRRGTVASGEVGTGRNLRVRSRQERKRDRGAGWCEGLGMGMVRQMWMVQMMGDEDGRMDGGWGWWMMAQRMGDGEWHGADGDGSSWAFVGQPAFQY